MRVVSIVAVAWVRCCGQVVGVAERNATPGRGGSRVVLEADLPLEPLDPLDGVIWLRTKPSESYGMESAGTWRLSSLQSSSSLVVFEKHFSGTCSSPCPV